MKTKIIAELGCNHNGNIDLAKQMIEECALLGIWGVKLQKRDVEGMGSERMLPRRSENSFGATYYEHRKALEFSPEQIMELYKLAKLRGLVFGVTVFDVVSAEQMRQLPLDFIKLPSQLYSNYAMCRAVLKDDDNAPEIFTSTGMHTMQEILEWQYLHMFDVVFYCRSMYPAGINDMNFAQMRTLSGALQIHQRLGFSSHDKDRIGIPVAVLLGAEYVERHYTLDKTMKGSDHATVSSDKADMLQIIESIEEAEDILGTGLRDFLPEQEKKIRKIYRGF